MPFKIHFRIRFWSDHNKMSMTKANINALYAGSLRMKISYFLFEKFYILLVGRNLSGLLYTLFISLVRNSVFQTCMHIFLSMLDVLSM